MIRVLVTLVRYSGGGDSDGDADGDGARSLVQLGHMVSTGRRITLRPGAYMSAFILLPHSNIITHSANEDAEAQGAKQLV